MRRVCDDGDPFTGGQRTRGGLTKCGAVYDDEYRSTICPHEYLAGQKPLDEGATQVVHQ